MARVKEVILGDVPPVPTKVIRPLILKAVKPSGSTAQQIAEDCGISQNEARVHLDKLVQKGSIRKVAHGDVTLFMRPRGASLIDQQKAALEKSPRGIVVDGQYLGKGDPEKAEESASSAAYQVNLGVPERWNDTDPEYVTEENPKGLKYYGVYRESATEPGVFELVIGDRRYLPKVWADFVLAAGSRKRKKELEGVESADAPDEEIEEAAADDVADEVAETTDEADEASDDAVDAATH